MSAGWPRRRFSRVGGWATAPLPFTLAREGNAEPSMTTPLAPPITIRTEAVPEGKVADFLTGQHVRDTPEEYVRQNLEKALVRQYKYDPRDCAPEFPIKVGSSRKRVDVVVFRPGAAHP